MTLTTARRKMLGALSEGRSTHFSELHGRRVDIYRVARALYEKGMIERSGQNLEYLRRTTKGTVALTELK